MLRVNVTTLEPDDDTLYLVGPEGLVWMQPAIGEPHIIAARNDTERQTAEMFVGALLEQGLVPYGLPLNQRVNQAMFGGSPIRDCRWVKHTDAPPPTGEADAELPKHAAVIQ